MDVYRGTVAKLLDQGDAYPCYCTEEELRQRREAALKRGEPSGYDGKCRDPEVRAAFEAEGRVAAIRFKMPDREHVLHDLVKGEIRWGPGHLRDFVLMRSDGTPVFLLAVAVDDMCVHRFPIANTSSPLRTSRTCVPSSVTILGRRSASSSSARAGVQSSITRPGPGRAGACWKISSRPTRRTFPRRRHRG